MVSVAARAGREQLRRHVSLVMQHDDVGVASAQASQ
jgi:hypothetical protein